MMMAFGGLSVLMLAGGTAGGVGEGVESTLGGMLGGMGKCLGLGSTREMRGRVGVGGMMMLMSLMLSGLMMRRMCTSACR